MKTKLINLIDFDKVNILLEGFNKSTGFVTAILDLQGNVLSKSGWRQICTDFHRVHPETSKRCTISDTVLAGKMEEGEKFHFYQCLNGLVDVAVPIVIKGFHIANLFSGQFFFEEPDRAYFAGQARKFGFDEVTYLQSLEKVPVVSKEKVKDVMEFLLNMTQMISEMTLQRLELTELNKFLQESEENSRTLFEESPIGLALTTLDGKLVNANPAYCKIIGRTLEETLQLTYWQITPIEYHEAENEIIRCLYETGLYGPYEKEYIHCNGNLIPVRLQGKLIERNGVKYIWSSIEDISEKKISEDLLRSSESKYRAIVEQSLTGIYIFSEDKFLYVNKRFTEIFGYSENEILTNLKPTDVIEVKDRHLAEESIQKRLSGVVDSVHYIAQGKHKDNRELWVEIHGTHIIYEGIDVITGTVLDITDRRLAEKALEESIKDFRSLAESMPQIVWATRPDGWTTYFNQHWVNYTGMTLEESYGHGWNKPFHPDDQRRAWDAWQNATHNNGVYSIEARLRRFDGEYRWWLVRGVPLTNDQGEIVKWFGTCTDIEDIKQTQKVLRENEELIRLSTELANVAAWEFDFTTNTMARSKNHDRLYGMEPQAVWAFETFVNATHPDDRELSNSTIQKSVAPGGPDKYKFDFRVIYPDQSIHWLNVIGEVIRRNERREGVLVRGFIIDITDRKLAEEAYQETAANLRSLIDNREDSIWSLDRNYNYVIFNTTYEQIFKHVNQIELKRGLDARQFLSPESADFWIPKYESVFEGETITFEFSHQFETGLRYFQTSINPIFEDNIITGASAISIDITDRKEAEVKIREQLNELRRWYEAMIKRENRVIELKKEVNELLALSGKPIRYASVNDDLLQNEDGQNNPQQ